MNNFVRLYSRTENLHVRTLLRVDKNQSRVFQYPPTQYKSTNCPADCRADWPTVDRSDVKRIDHPAPCYEPTQRLPYCPNQRDTGNTFPIGQNIFHTERAYQSDYHENCYSNCCSSRLSEQSPANLPADGPTNCPS